MELPNPSSSFPLKEIEAQKISFDLLRFYNFTEKPISESIEAYLPVYGQLIESFRIGVNSREIKQILHENEVLIGEKVHRALLLGISSIDHELDRLIQAFCCTYTYNLIVINISRALEQPFTLSENISKQINEWLKLQHIRLINSAQSNTSTLNPISKESLQNIPPQSSDQVIKSLDQKKKSDDSSIPGNSPINSKENSHVVLNESNSQKIHLSVQPFIVFADFTSIPVILQNQSVLNPTDTKFSLQQIRREIQSAFRSLDIDNELGLLIIIGTTEFTTEPGLDQEFDAILPVPVPDLDSRREFFLHTVLPTWTSFIDFTHFAMETEGWSFGMIREFLRYARWLFILAQKQSIGEKLQFDTKFLLDALQKYQTTHFYSTRMNSKKIISSSMQSNLIDFSSEKIDSSSPFKKELTSIDAIATDFETQLYQSAATSQYDDLVIALDKMSKGLVLTDYERQNLADNAFLLKDSPSKSLQKLHKAKLRMDKILSLNPKHNQKMKSVIKEQNNPISRGESLESKKSENNLPD